MYAAAGGGEEIKGVRGSGVGLTYITKVSDFEITIGKYVPFAPRENYRQN